MVNEIRADNVTMDPEIVTDTSPGLPKPIITSEPIRRERNRNLMADAAEDTTGEEQYEQSQEDWYDQDGDDVEQPEEQRGNTSGDAEMFEFQQEDAETCSNMSYDDPPTADDTCTLQLDKDMDRQQLNMWRVDLAQAEYIQRLAESRGSQIGALNSVWHGGFGFKEKGAYAKAQK